MYYYVYAIYYTINKMSNNITNCIIKFRSYNCVIILIHVLIDLI